jgi:DNA (cytosine-5)-methyltransferase 1
VHLGPARAKKAGVELGVDGHGLADLPPENDFDGMPGLTLKMAAMIQGFPADWQFVGKQLPPTGRSVMHFHHQLQKQLANLF